MNRKVDLDTLVLATLSLISIIVLFVMMICGAVRESKRREICRQAILYSSSSSSEESTSSSTVIEYESLGEFRLTIYTPESDGGRWGYKTATGTRSEHLLTCAVDPNVIPYGSIILIGGLRLKAVDCGNKVNGKHIDIFYDGTEAEALNWLMLTFGDYAEVRKEVTNDKE